MKTDPERVPLEEELIDAFRGEQRRHPDYTRKRGLSGYSYYLGIRIDHRARRIVKTKGSFKWYDMCCGTFQAGRELVAELTPDVLPFIEVRGIDIDPSTPDNEISHGGSLGISRGDVVTSPLPPDIDLITCVGGLYLIKDYLGLSKAILAIEHWYNSLSLNGLLAITRDPPDVKIAFNMADYLKKQLGDTAVRENKPLRTNPPGYHDYTHVTRLNLTPLKLPQIS